MTTVTHPAARASRAELAPQHAEIVAATLPLVSAHIDEIASEFYRRMFTERPELLRNLFNRGNQAQGAQQRALAASIATFATHLVDPDLPHPADLLSRVSHRHASLGITEDLYPIVHEHLFAAIVEVLGEDVVTDEVASAWDRLYWLMAHTLIGLEHELYSDAGVEDGDVYRRARVVSRADDPSGAVLLTVRSVAEPFPKFRPAQYVSVGVTMPDGARQLRQFNLINPPSGDDLVFAVQPVAGTDGEPAGEVSNWIRANLCVGDILDITVPFGDLPPPTGREPLVLISAGIGITPVIGILEFLAAECPETPVRALHADRSVGSHTLRERQRALINRLPNAVLDIWYEEGPADGSGGVHPGLLTVDGVDIPDDAQVYLCGSDGFLQQVRAQLDAREVPAERVHYEQFSPSDWLA